MHGGSLDGDISLIDLVKLLHLLYWVKKRLEGDKVMKIKAKYGVENVTIIAFVPAFDNCVEAVYVRDDGRIDTCFVKSSLTKTDDCWLTITDENYIPQRR